MKKTYINPTINVVRIQTMQMLAASTLELKSGNASEWGGARGSDFEEEE